VGTLVWIMLQNCRPHPIRTGAAVFMVPELFQTGHDMGTQSGVLFGDERSLSKLPYSKFPQMSTLCTL